MNTSIEQYHESEHRQVKLARWLAYFYVFLSFIGAFIFFDFSPDLIYITVGSAIIYIGLSIVIGWLILSAISKKSKNSYIIPLIVFLISLLGFCYDLDGFTISVGYIISIFEIITLVTLFFIMRNCYIKFSWEKESERIKDAPLEEAEDKNKSVVDKIFLNFLKYFNGGGALLNAFSGYFILGNFVTLLLYIAVFKGYKYLFGFESYIAASVVINIASVIIIISYFLLSVRIMWKCAGNSSYSGFYYIVRGVIILFLAFMIFSLIQFVIDIGNIY